MSDSESDQLYDDNEMMLNEDGDIDTFEGDFDEEEDLLEAPEDFEQ